MELGVVVNANARSHRRRPEQADALRQHLGGLGELRLTHSLEELPGVLEALLAKGAKRLVSVGGDGALHRMHNALVALKRSGRIEALPPLLPTRGGTINFVAQKLGLHLGPVEQLKSIRERIEGGLPLRQTRLDVLAVDATTTAWEEEHVVGYAMAAGGVGQRFFEQFYALHHPKPRDIVRVAAIASGSQLLGRMPAARRFPRAWLRPGERMFAPTLAKVTIDGELLDARRHSALHAGAFDVNLGGVFRTFPLAETPGTLHFQAGEVSPGAVMQSVPRLVQGKVLQTPGLHERAGETMLIEAEGEALSPVLDGEFYRGWTRLLVQAGEPLLVEW